MNIASSVGRVRVRADTGRAPHRSSGSSGVVPYRGGGVPLRRGSGSAVSVASAAGASSVFSGGVFSHIATASMAATAPAPAVLSLGAQALAAAKQLLSDKVITFAEYCQAVAQTSALDAAPPGHSGAAAPGAPPAVGGGGLMS